MARFSIQIQDKSGVLEWKDLAGKTREEIIIECVRRGYPDGSVVLQKSPREYLVFRKGRLLSENER